MTQTKSNSRSEPIPQPELLEQAIDQGDPDLLRQWLSLGMDLNDRRLATPDAEEGELALLAGTPLLTYVAYRDHANRCELLEMLLQAGADPYEHKSAGGVTALMKVKDAQTAALLIEYGADVNARSRDGCISPVYTAVFDNDLDRLELLYKADASLDGTYSYGRNLLHFGHENLAICKWLIENCPQLMEQRANCSSGLGDTPMTLAIKQGSMAGAQMMVSMGAEINVPIFIKDDPDSGKKIIARDAIEAAEIYKRPDMADWLRAYQSAQIASDTLRAIAKSAQSSSSQP